MQSDRKRLEADRVCRQGAMDSATALLAAIASGRYADGATTLDHRLADDQPRELQLDVLIKAARPPASGSNRAWKKRR